MKILNVLIVDDDRGFARSLKNLLTVEAHQVTLAHSGEVAIELSREYHYDITFMDVKLPGINGVEAFGQIRQFKPASKIIMMTAFTVEQLLQQAMDGGAVATIRKPLDIDKVFEILNEVSPAGIILIADDDPEFVQSVKNVLVQEGFSVFVAFTGEEAVDYALNNKIDILILDLRLPVMNGLEVYLKIKQHERSVPTMVVTGYAQEEKESIDLLNQMEITGCLTKPFDMDKLLNAVHKLV
jgi:two-component system response regulator HydG